MLVLNLILHSKINDVTLTNNMGIANGNSGVFTIDELVSFSVHYHGNTVI